MIRQLFLILLLALLLTGCASRVPETAPEPPVSAPTAEASAAESVPPTWDYAAADSAAMSSYMSGARWLVDGERMYGLDYDAALRPVLASYRLADGKPGDFEILCADCAPEYLTLHEERLYYLSEGRLERLTLESGRREVLHEGPLRSLQMFDGALYWTDAEGRFCRAGLDGRNAQVLIEGPCDYAWAMPEGLIYQSEAEGCCLRLRLPDGSDRRLTAAASYAPLRVGTLVWYSQRDSLGSVLASVDLTDGTVTRYETPSLRGAAELIPVGGEWRLRCFLDTDSWKQLLLRPGETEGERRSYSGYRLCDWVGETARIDAAYDPDGRLRCFVLVGADGGETRFFGGELLG